MSIFFIFLLSLSAIISTTAGDPLSDEISALRAFKSSIKPSTIPSYSCLASWNFTSHPCSFPHTTHFICGLTCYNSRVTQLTLDPAGYSGTLSPLISKLTELTHLDISENNFFGPIPPSLSSLANLQILSLRFNSFSGWVPPSVFALKKLESLDLSHNSLSGSLPNTLNSATSLTRLDLSYNKLTGSIPKLPPNLYQIAIKANSLSGFLYQTSFTESTRLDTVELSENSLVGVLQPWFFNLPSLQQVNLSKNKFTGVVISKPQNPESNLVAVDLGFNKIQGNLPVNFLLYPMLSSLTLSYNRLRGPIPLEYSKKQRLRRLFLDGNYLNGSPPSDLISGKTEVLAGNLGDNCLKYCPASSSLCSKSQKATWICRQAYGKPRL
ncbi:hypothetical protein DCAR_0624175 [Daucus carota subsp. sativus]|uniref:Leucine-rich repeat-containing N-terminal plant-type domain-containing protein n=1 Tax=Daucus carota subsp. sativus TaxID=79200 RepID=A0A161ZUY2_DAUCS|nr:PREDICTED: leucine-rich repeat receptor-like serine/threonine-protein kinase BAM1 [Daucus carota subsp. sativus]WOH04763.1 hypothetical protein DCAR_0624175 [Daucus carota subsp. sativus]